MTPTIPSTIPSTILPTTTTKEVLGRPTEIGDIQYVGVVVGAICIALFTLFSCLTIISARRSNSRDSRRREVQSASCQEEDDRPDVVAENAPPSYDAVMACPDMYPPTPQGTPAGTPETTPHLSLHRRALLNQHGGSLPGTPQIQRQSLTPAVSEEWDEGREEPPPPYPGIANGNVENRISGSNTRIYPGNRNADENTPELSNPRVSTPAFRRRTGDVGESDTSPVDDRDADPWVLNRMNENSRENYPSGNSSVRRNSRDDNRHERRLDDRHGTTEEFALRVRTAEPESDEISPDEESQRASVSTTNTDHTVDDVIEYNDSGNTSDRVPKSDMNHGDIALPHLTMV